LPSLNLSFFFIVIYWDFPPILLSLLFSTLHPDFEQLLSMYVPAFSLNRNKSKTSFRHTSMNNVKYEYPWNLL
jgi:hypothetical protein